MPVVQVTEFELRKKRKEKEKLVLKMKMKESLYATNEIRDNTVRQEWSHG